MLAFLRLSLLGLHCAIASALGLLFTLCRPFHPDNSRLCARLFGLPALRILGLRVEADVDSLVSLDRPCVIVANHQSNHDLFVIGSLVPPRTVSMGKKSLKWIPLFGQLYWLAGNLLVDRENARNAVRALHNGAAMLKSRNANLFVFPEGTRNPQPGLLPFKKGAFQLAMAAGVPVVPLCVSSYPAQLDLSRRTAAVVRVRSLPPIETQGLGQAELAQLVRKVREDMLACIAELDAEPANEAEAVAESYGK